MKENGKNYVTETTANGNLVMVREAINDKSGKQLTTDDGRLYFSYVVRGYIRGREKKIDFVPKDKGGYEPLDIVFDISSKAELLISEEKMTDGNGNTTSYTAYKVVVTDEDGEVWECAVKPQRDSDKTLLNFLLIEMRKANKVAN